jgi:integrase
MTAGRPRNQDKHLPKRMYERRGAYFFVDSNGKWNPLGREYGRAIEKYNRLNDDPVEVATIGDLIDRYMREESPTKAAATHKSNQKHARFLRAAFGRIQPPELTTRAIYMYMDARNAPVVANRELAMLSHMFKKAIRWGIVDSNPCLGVERNPEKPRDRYIEDWEYQAFRQFIPAQLAAYMDLKLLTGLRQKDMLSLRIDQLKEDGIHIHVSKTKRHMIIRWSDFLKQSVDAALAARTTHPAKASAYVFCTRKGRQYTSDGFRTIWQRWMTNAVKKGILQERFREHDLRAKTGSDTDLAHAVSLLSHMDRKTTQRHYRRKAEIVEPLR